MVSKQVFITGRWKKEDKDKNQNEFMTGKENVIVCTIAFGMGVDKKISVILFILMFLTLLKTIIRKSAGRVVMVSPLTALPY